MIDNEFQSVGLYDHNADSYRKVKSKFEAGEDIVGIVHATGTGKSYNALQLAYDNKDKHIVYVVPSNGIIEHIKKIIDDNPNLDLKRDFQNLEFRTYQSFISLDKEEIADINCDLLILDEFHHIGAPVWGARINTMIETHPNIKIFGMTAYTVRDRGTSYERDMALTNGKELFSDKIVSRYDLVDAFVDGILPKPIYRSAYICLLDMYKAIEERIKNGNYSTKEYNEYMKILSKIKKRIDLAPSAKDLVLNHIKKDGKYIYFCPIGSDINDIMSESKKWFEGYDVEFYKSTSEDGEIGKYNRDCFYNDLTLQGTSAKNKLRIIFVINQYNEGVHAPLIDGVILGRSTLSDIVFFEEIGRALSVRDDYTVMYDYYSKLSIEKLINEANKKGISVKNTKSEQEIINSLVAPIIIDLFGNIEFIKELENNLKDRVKEYQLNNRLNSISGNINPENISFDIVVDNQDLMDVLLKLKERIYINKWDQMYDLAKKYFAHYHNLEVPYNFITINGYDRDVNGDKLGVWISTQRFKYSNNTLSSEKIAKLELINMRFSSIKNVKPDWDQMYDLTLNYYEHFGNLDVPADFKTLNGYEYNEKGFKLKNWIINQTTKIKSKEFKMSILNRRKSDENIESFFSMKVLSDEQYINLLSIGFKSGDGYSNANENRHFCDDYKITNKQQRLLLRKKSYYEVLIIAKFLFDNNIPIQQNGNANEMFFMSGIEMKKKYGFYRHDLLKETLVSIKGKPKQY